jgi:hypothetical protein
MRPLKYKKRKTKRVKSNKTCKSRRKRRITRRGGCDKCVSSSYESDGQWTSGPMIGGGQNEDYSNYMLNLIPYSVA